MSRILVVEDSRPQALQIQLQLTDASFEVDLACDGEQAMKVLAQPPSGAIDLVLTDLEMPRMNGLELVEAVRREFSHIPVVVMTAHGSEDVAARALSKGAASYIPKAYLVQDMVPTLTRILSLTQVRREHVHAFDCLTTTEFHYALRNEPTLIPPILGYLDETLRLVNLCDATARVRISVALQEALVNAMYHGNLEVSSALRQDDENVFHDLVKARREEAPFKYRRVYFDVRVAPQEASFTVRDEGDGFDVDALPDPSAPENLERIGGRGLLLIRKFMDRVVYNDRGNSITMLKRRES